MVTVHFMHLCRPKYETKNGSFQTQPEFSTEVSKTRRVVCPVAVEIFAAVLSPLKHLNRYINESQGVTYSCSQIEHFCIFALLLIAVYFSYVCLSLA